MIDLGFATITVYDQGKIDIPDDQLSIILNLDESCLSLNGNERRGGRPSVVFCDPNLPNPGKTVSKSSVSLKFIGGSNALGEALPPHLQFSTSAKTSEREKIRLDIACHLLNGHGKWGMNRPVYKQVTMGHNKKGGMDDDEFFKYILNSIVPLFTDTVSDEPGKRVLVKIDSGPGRRNVEMLVRLKNLEFYLYLGVPNTTSISQETDQNYGMFNSAF